MSVSGGLYGIGGGAFDRSCRGRGVTRIATPGGVAMGGELMRLSPAASSGSRSRRCSHRPSVFRSDQTEVGLLEDVDLTRADLRRLAVRRHDHAHLPLPEFTICVFRFASCVPAPWNVAAGFALSSTKTSIVCCADELTSAVTPNAMFGGRLNAVAFAAAGRRGIRLRGLRLRRRFREVVDHRTDAELRRGAGQHRARRPTSPCRRPPARPHRPSPCSASCRRRSCTGSSRYRRTRRIAAAFHELRGHELAHAVEHRLVAVRLDGGGIVAGELQQGVQIVMGKRL